MVPRLDLTFELVLARRIANTSAVLAAFLDLARNLNV